MKTFNIKVLETYSRLINIDANNLKEALDKIDKQHENGEIELMGDYNHYYDVEFKDETNYTKQEKINKIKDMIEDVDIQILEGKNGISLGIFVYKGSNDPVLHLDNAIAIYVGDEKYNEFIDANMDNPWVRIVVKGGVLY